MNDLTFALEKTKEFNKLVLNDKELSKIFVFGKYNFLQLYNPLIFLDFRNYYKKNNTEMLKDKNQKQSYFSVLFFAFFAIVLSFKALIWFKIRQKKIIIFSNDVCNSQYQGDFRLTKIYKYLISKKIKFGEIFFSANDRRIFNNFIWRRRLAFYSQTIDVFYRLFGQKKEIKKKKFFLNGGNENERIMNEILNIYLKTIPLTEFRIKFFEKILNFLNIRLILTIDSVRRYGELIAAGKNLGIEVFAFQHGQFTKYQTGWLDMTGNIDNVIKPNKLFVWADYWKEELLRLGTYYKNDEINFCENTKSDITVSEYFNESGENILMFFETDAPKDLAVQYIEKILKCPGVKIYFKTRPDRDLSKQLIDYGLDKNNSNIEIVSDVDEILNRINIVLGFQSTMLYEMIVRGKSVGVLESDLDYTDGLIFGGFSEKISLNNTCSKLELLSKKSEKELIDLSHKFTGYNVEKIDNVLKQYV